MALKNWTDYPRFWLAALPPASENYDMVILANDDDLLYWSDGNAWVPYNVHTGGLVPPTAYLNEGSPLVPSASSFNVVGLNADLSASGSALTLSIVGPEIRSSGTPLVTTPTAINFTGTGVSTSNAGDVVTVTINGAPISAFDEGSLLSSSIQSLNFVGGGVTASAVGPAITVTIPSPPTITVKDEGTNLTTALTSLNFTGAAVVATNSAGDVTVTINDTTVLAGSAPPAIAATGAAGTSSSVARADHTHAGVTSVNGNQGAVTVAVPSPSSTLPLAIGTAAAGTATPYAREDHVHAHGNQAGGTLHAAVTTSVNGFMLSTDKARFDRYTPNALTVAATAPSSPSTGDLWVDTSSAPDTWTYVQLAADFSTVSTTAVAITGMDFPPDPNSTYVIEAMGLMRTSNTSCGSQIGIAWSGGLTDGVARISQNFSATAQDLDYGNITANFSSRNGGLPNTTASHVAELSATIVSGASPTGNTGLTLKSELGNSVTIKAGSWMRYRKI